MLSERGENIEKLGYESKDKEQFVKAVEFYLFHLREPCGSNVGEKLETHTRYLNCLKKLLGEDGAEGMLGQKRYEEVKRAMEVAEKVGNRFKEFLENI